jgi:hypothetical protein
MDSFAPLRVGQHSFVQLDIRNGEYGSSRIRQEENAEGHTFSTVKLFGTPFATAAGKLENRF